MDKNLVGIHTLSSLKPPQWVAKHLPTQEQPLGLVIANVRILLSDCVRQDHIRCSAQDMAEAYEFVQRLEELSHILSSGYSTSTTDIPQEEQS